MKSIVKEATNSMESLRVDNSAQMRRSSSPEGQSVKKKRRKSSTPEDQTGKIDENEFNELFEPRRTDPCEVIKENIRVVNRKHRNVEDDHGIQAAQIEDEGSTSFSEQCTVKLTFDVSELPDAIRRAWEIEEEPTVTLVFEGIDKIAFRRRRVRPRIITHKGYDTDASVFLVGTALKNMAFNKLEETYTVEESIRQTDPEYFLGLYDFLNDRIDSLTDFCYNCCEPLEQKELHFSHCDKELCHYQHDELDMYTGSFFDLRVSPEVFSFLFYAFLCAAKSDRQQSILQPRPIIQNRGAFFKDLRTMDHDHDPILPPNFHEIPHDDQMKIAWEVLEKRHPCPSGILAYLEDYDTFRECYREVSRLHEWIVASNTAYIVHLTGTRLFKQFDTPHQFLFVEDSIAKRRQFRQLAEENRGRTKIFYHGSPSENWHSIIRGGLEVMSGTHRELHGKSEGPGIYLSRKLKTAYHHASSTVIEREACGDLCCFSSIPQYVGEPGYRVVAVVEVVDTEEAFAHRSKGVVVVADGKWCTIRMILVFPPSSIEDLEMSSFDLRQALLTISKIRQELFLEDLTGTNSYFQELASCQDEEWK